LSIAALPTDRFCFEGFLPARGAARRARLEALARESARWSSTNRRIASRIRSRIARLLRPERRAAVARELTKMHDLYRGSLAELLRARAEDADFDARRDRARDRRRARARSGARQRSLDRVLVLLAELPLKQAAQLAAQIPACATTKPTSARCSSNAESGLAICCRICADSCVWCGPKSRPGSRCVH
jgi:16S rRNA (cytidine1402-2'-O)-methyltransferase